MSLPTIALTMGDAAGVGPEIIVKALARADVARRSHVVVIGDARRLELAARICKLPISVRRVDERAFNLTAHAPPPQTSIDCMDLGLIPDDLPFGRLSG